MYRCALLPVLKGIGGAGLYQPNACRDVFHQQRHINSTHGESDMRAFARVACAEIEAHKYVRTQALCIDTFTRVRFR